MCCCIGDEVFFVGFVLVVVGSFLKIELLFFGKWFIEMDVCF